MRLNPPASDMTYEGSCDVTEVGSCQFLARQQFGTSIVIASCATVEVFIALVCCGIWCRERKNVVDIRQRIALDRRKLPEMSWLMATHRRVGRGTAIHSFVRNPLFDPVLLRLIFDHYGTYITSIVTSYVMLFVMDTCCGG
jgi:hypothetical protein